MVAAFFPVQQLSGTLSVSSTLAQTDESESAWSITARAVQGAEQRLLDKTFGLRFDGTLKRLTVFRATTFTLSCSAAVATLTGLPTSGTGATSYTGTTLANVIVVDGLRMGPPGWSVGMPRVTADGKFAGPLRWQSAALTCAVALEYADAFATIRTLRAGVWDVVNEGMWLGRMRVTGTQLQPQGRLPGIVEVTINGVATP